MIWQIGMVLLLLAMAAAPAQAAGPGKVVVGFNSDVRSFDPVNTMDVTTDRVVGHIYQYLFTRDHEMKILPLLAESARIVDDLTWEIKLKKGVRFSDGEPFNAETVKANIVYVGYGIQPPIPAWGNMLAEGKSYMARAWWLTVLPGVAISLTCLSTTVLGDRLTEILDPPRR